MLLDVTVPGRPYPLRRPRVVNKRAYDPPENVAAKDRIRWHVRWRDVPYSGPVVIDITCSYTARTSTADVDNLAKTVLDALNRYALADDRQVQELRIRKQYLASSDATVIQMWAAQKPTPQDAASPARSGSNRRSRTT